MEEDVFDLQWEVKEFNEPVRLSGKFYSQLKDEFPDVDINKQLIKAHEYAELNFVDPSYSSGLKTFIERWMKRNQLRAEQSQKFFRRADQ